MKMEESRQLEETFSTRLNEAIAQSGQGVMQICRKARISRNRLLAWRKGGQIPSLPNLLLLCETLEVSADWLCGLEGGTDA